jgi:outer membrane protein OmpA-like peptidoglycan-associated protein
MNIKNAALAAVLFTGCATAVPPNELVNARTAYGQAAGGAAMKYKPDNLHVAKVSLDAAEQSFKDDGDNQKTKDLAYVATRRAQVAESEGQTARAVETKATAEKQYQQQTVLALKQTKADLHGTQAQLNSTSQQLAMTDQKLALTDQQLAQQQQQLAVEQAARIEAEKRAQDAMTRLAAAQFAVKKDTRGTVITLPGNLLFESSKSELLVGARQKLDQVAAALKDQPDRKIRIEGHTDSRGSSATNQALSQDRAQSVASYLLTQGLPADRIQTVGMGASSPVASNDNAEGRADNRRVEIIVAAGESR